MEARDNRHRLIVNIVLGRYADRVFLILDSCLSILLRYLPT